MLSIENRKEGVNMPECHAVLYSKTDENPAKFCPFLGVSMLRSIQQEH
jgi:hypothetical protein